MSRKRILTRGLNQVKMQEQFQSEVAKFRMGTKATVVEELTNSTLNTISYNPEAIKVGLPEVV